MVLMMMSCIMLKIGTVSASESEEVENDDLQNENAAYDDYNPDDGDGDGRDDYEDDDDDDDDDDDENISFDETRSLQNYIDDKTGEVKSFDPNEQFPVELVNLSQFRADVYWDDGNFGVSMSTVDVGGTTVLNTNQGRGFFVTRHGVRENLYPKEVEGEEDVPLRFKAQKPNQQLVIPEGASPLSGERANRNRCVDRYGMCAKEGECYNIIRIRKCN